MRKTKIICTLGPATDDENVLRQLMLEGMNVVRFNFSHQTHEEHKKRYETVCRLRDELNLPVATLLDTKGPEIRLHTFQDGHVTLEDGQDFTIYTQKEIVGTAKEASVTYKGLSNDIAVGTRILMDDGLLEMEVRRFTQDKVVCRVIHGGVLSNRKSLNLPGRHLSLPYLSEQDESDIIFGIEMGFDFIAASFVRSAEDILKIKDVLNRHDCHNIRIIAKIENAEGVENLDEIIRVSDGIMVARGDMGVEIDYEKIPAIQKMMIKKAYSAGKQVITATQMLDSMIKNPRPTRAETTDVANAIYDGTSAIMLSGETAAGAYPVEALRAMVKIAIQTEADIDYYQRFQKRMLCHSPNITNAISEATVTTAHNLTASGIVTVSKSGQTACMISKYRPACPIIGCSFDRKVLRQMNLSWGVIPVYLEEEKNTDALFQHAIDMAVKQGVLGQGDLAVITAGVPLGISGTTNMIKVHIVGNVAVTGTGVTKNVICANLCVCKNAQEARQKFIPGEILVIPETDNSLMSIMKDAAGIITEQEGLNSHAAVVGLTLDKPVIVGVQHATELLKDGLTYTIDAGRGIVCNEN